MKTGALFFLTVIFCFFTHSCAPQKPDDETLLLYVRSRDVYTEGRFAEAAEMLSEENNFVPSLILRGKAEYLSGDLAAAENTMKRVLTVENGNAEASFFLARIFRETGNTGKALELAEKLLSEHPYDVRILRFAAGLERENGIQGEAVSALLLDRAVEVSAETALVFLDRARGRWKGGNSAGAIDDLERAKALLSNNSPVIKAVERLESIIREVSQ